jgi:hypothetical protein
LGLWDANQIYEDLLAKSDTQCRHDVCHGNVGLKLESNKWILLLTACQTPIARIFPHHFNKTFREGVSKLKNLVKPWNSGQTEDVIRAINKWINPQRPNLVRHMDLFGDSLSYDVAPIPSWFEARKEDMVRPSPFGHDGCIYDNAERPTFAPGERTVNHCFLWLDNKFFSQDCNERQIRARFIHLDWWMHHNVQDRARCCLLQMALDFDGPNE